MNTDIFKEKLEAEQKQLLSELSHLGHQEKGDWNATPTDFDHGEKGGAGELEPDSLDQGRVIEEYEERFSTEGPLEKRLVEVRSALAQMEKGEYGTCTKEGTPHAIEEARLMANPAAQTCIAHTA